MPDITTTTSEVPTTVPPLYKENEIYIKTYRKDGVTMFQFHVPPRIVEIYATQSASIKESSNWPTLKFYYAPNVIESEPYRRLLENYHLFDNYGQPIYDGRRLNIAWMRTVGGEGEFKINDNVSFAELCNLTKGALQFIKEYFEEYFRPFEIEGRVEVKF